MARKTTNYGFNISEGNDLVNPLTDIFPNFEDIDTDLKGVSDSAVGTATELLTGTVHALVRSDSDRNVFTFTATSNFEAGETFTLDGVQVTALTPDGQTLSTGCYIIGSEVLVAVKGTLMTVYVNPSKSLDSDKLDGHDSTYYATASDVSDLSGDVSALSSKVGIGTLTVGNDCVDGINTLDGRLTQSFVEHEVGIYVDSSGISHKMYEKTVNCGALPDNNSKEIPFGSTYSKILSISGMAYLTNGQSMAIPAAWKEHRGDNTLTAVLVYVFEENIRLGTYSNMSTIYTNSEVTVRYIKD